jgi:hypothetical protein
MSMAMRTAGSARNHPDRSTATSVSPCLGQNALHAPRAQDRRGDCAVPAVPFVGGLALAGRSADARALAGFIPDCIVLFRRLLGDSRMPRRYRAIVVALALRAILRAGGLEMIEELWPGPRSSLSVILKLADPGAKKS